MESLRTHLAGEVVAIGGKTVRRSHDRAQDPSLLHLVNAWAQAPRRAWGQTVVDNKSHEITAIPGLLSMLALAGCGMTIDALGCHQRMA